MSREDCLARYDAAFQQLWSQYQQTGNLQQFTNGLHQIEHDLLECLRNEQFRRLNLR